MIRGLRRCAPFSLPPRAIIEKKQSGILLGQMPSFCIPQSLTKTSFRRSFGIQKIAQPKVARFASSGDSVGIRESAVFYRGIRCFTGSFGVG